MAKPQVLILIDWFYPGYKAGGPIRSCYNMISHLKDRVDFSIITTDSDYTDTVPYPGVKADQWNILPNGMRVYYISKARLTSDVLSGLLHSEKFDYLYLNGPFSKFFTIRALRIAADLKNITILLAARGMLSPNALALKSFKKSVFLKLAKLTGVYRKVIFLASSETEAADIHKVMGEVNVKVAPNLPDKEVSPKGAGLPKTPSSLELVSIARVAPEKNQLGAIEILEKWGAQSKSLINYTNYGPVYDQPYFERCGAAVKKLPPNVSVQFKPGILQEEVPGILGKYHMLFLPTRGENFGHAIIQSLRRGLPVIISDKTPWRDLEGKGVGYDIPLADIKKWISVLNECVSMPEEDYKRISASAWRFGEAYAGNNLVLNQNLEIFGLA